MMRRVIWIVLDSVGMGAMPDAKEFGDEGSNTLGNIVKVRGKLHIPNMIKLGLGNIEGMTGIDKTQKPLANYARMAEQSNGKDTTIGHWEMTGIYSSKKFPVYPKGFPTELVEEWIHRAQLPGVLWNALASGTKIIEQLGEEHIKTRKPILYTSADSVFQIACHEEVYAVEQLYHMCKIARELLQGEHNVGRVIARPFVGQQGNFVRTSNRRDFSRKPPKDNLLVYMAQKGLMVYAIGKIEDIFAGCGITKSVHTKDNQEGINCTIQAMKERQEGLIFTNLVEFDSKWGHRNDVEGYANGLEEFDVRLPEVMEAMEKEDILVITADHGCDPTTPSTDHSREYVPLLVYGKSIKAGVNLGTRGSFADTGSTVAEIFQLPHLPAGKSFYSQIISQ